MPKKMIWIEALFARMPVDMRKRRDQILLRLSFMFLLWLSGFLAFAFDGLGAEYVSNLPLFIAFFGSGLIILFGSYMVQNSLADVVLSIRPLSRLDDVAFKKFFEKMELYSYSFVPAFLIAVLFTVFAPGNRITLAHLTGMFESLHGAWTVPFMFFFNLLSATGIWMGVSIWLTIFLISRQPLQVELSSKTVKEFRGLANMALAFAAFYFLAVAIGVILPLSSEPMFSLVDVITSPLIIYLLIGAVGVLLPFYNIHLTLVSLKRRELLKIEEEYELMETRLRTAQNEQIQKSSEESLALMHSLSSLQIRERRVKAAKEWPIDIGFVSKLAGLILAPAVARILPEILNWLTL